MSFVEQLGLWWQQPARSVEETTLKSPLPTSVKKRLLKAVAKLPVPTPFSDIIHEGLLEAIAAWQDNPERSNSLVVLASPAEPIADIVQQSLLHWQVLDERSLKVIKWHAIPAKPTVFVSGLRKTVREQLQGETEKQEQVPLRFSADGVQLEPEQRSQRGVVLPSLTQYFVRCIEGLEGVIYLRKEILKNPRRFWIIGCNLWSWQYLSYVTQMDAYFEHVVTLPALTGEQLRNWLAPTKVVLAQHLPKVTPTDDSLEKGYFDTLARVSLGLSSVAGQTWPSALQVNCVEQVRESGKSTDSAEAAKSSVVGKWFGFERPNQTKLPPIHPGDRALLYSLLLHEGLRLQHLALSLGASESTLLPRIQELIRLGILGRQGRMFVVKPQYYPALKSDLSRNNFLVGES